MPSKTMPTAILEKKSKGATKGERKFRNKVMAVELKMEMPAIPARIAKRNLSIIASPWPGQ